MKLSYFKYLLATSLILCTQEDDTIRLRQMSGDIAAEFPVDTSVLAELKELFAQDELKVVPDGHLKEFMRGKCPILIQAFIKGDYDVTNRVYEFNFVTNNEGVVIRFIDKSKSRANLLGHWVCPFAWSRLYTIKKGYNGIVDHDHSSGFLGIMPDFIRTIPQKLLYLIFNRAYSAYYKDPNISIDKVIDEATEVEGCPILFKPEGHILYIDLRGYVVPGKPRVPDSGEDIITLYCEETYLSIENIETDINFKIPNVSQEKLDQIKTILKNHSGFIRHPDYTNRCWFRKSDMSEILDMLDQPLDLSEMEVTIPETMKLIQGYNKLQCRSRDNIELDSHQPIVTIQTNVETLPFTGSIRKFLTYLLSLDV